MVSSPRSVENDDRFHDVEQALLDATSAAWEIVGRFTEAWQTDPLAPEAAVELKSASDEAPLYVFTILLGLEEDFDADEYPTEDVERLKSDLIRRIVDSPVHAWRWMTTVGTKAGAARS